MALGDFLKSILSRISRDATQIQKSDAKSYFELIKSEILKEVEDHPISKELTNHTNPSDFLSGARGTLFGFLGFDKTAPNPVSTLISYLNENIRYTVKKRILRGVQLTITIPDYKEMRSNPNLTLPWDSLSWPESIEKGISGLGYYLFTLKSPNSRSSEGVQLQHKLSELNYRPTKYLSAIFERAQKKLNRYR